MCLLHMARARRALISLSLPYQIQFNSTSILNINDAVSSTMPAPSHHTTAAYHSFMFTLNCFVQRLRCIQRPRPLMPSMIQSLKRKSHQDPRQSNSSRGFSNIIFHPILLRRPSTISIVCTPSNVPVPFSSQIPLEHDIHLCLFMLG